MPQLISRPVFQVSVLAIALFQVASLFARSMVEVSLVRDGMTRSVAQDLSYLAVPPLLVVLMWPYLKRSRTELCRLLRPSGLTVRVVLLSLLLGLTLRFVFWATLTVLIRNGVVGSEDPNAVVEPVLGFGCPSPAILLLSLGVMAFLVPITEEVINRGFILHALLPRGFVISIGASALLFALMHPPGGYLFTFLVGILLGIQVLNYGTLWAPVLAHASYNAAAVFDWECLQIVWNPPASDPQLTALAAVGAPAAVLGICLAVFIVTRKTAGARAAPRRH
jgi:membrane protease YdiL (CAAX protease family)